MPVTVKHFVSAGILAQLAGEAEARKEYEIFLDHYADELDDDDIEVFEEIQADEANHMLKLQAMVKKYDGNIAASPDGIEQAVTTIVKGATK